MDLVTGAMGSLITKLLQLLQEEYKLQKDMRNEVKSLSEEMESVAAALQKVAEVPWYQLDEQVKVWARQVRDTSYNMEDVLDTFLVRIKGHEHVDPSGLKRAMKKMGDLFTKGKARHDIATAIKSIKEQVQEVAERRQRYKIDDIIVAMPAATTNDPRLSALYKNPSQLVGIDEPRDAVIEMLSVGEGHTSCKEKKIVSIVGSGGMGKTTLAKAVLDKVETQFDCCAFVPVGQNPDPRKVLRDILIEFEKTKLTSSHGNKSLSLCDLKELDERQLINELHKYLEAKRYLIIVDDIWETSTWRTVNLPFADANCASRILITTRISQVSTEIGGEVYRIEGLSAYNSKQLLYTITIGGEEHHPSSDELDEITDTIIQKCRGVPLAIITIAGVLARKPTKEWFDVYNSIGFRPDDDQVEDMKKILSFSYYNLPYHLKTCFLYLSVFEEDWFIEKNNLIMMWEAEGFIQKESGRDFIEVGNSYLQELISRNMVIPNEDKQSGLLDGCRIHDMLLRLIRQISVEENFIVALRGEQQSLVAQDNIRRLALLMTTVETNYKDMGRVRSFVAIIGGTKFFSSLCSFRALRVLVLEYCLGMESYSLEHIVNLLHLRYIGLSHTPVLELPKKIGRLKFLQTLLLDDTGLKELPASVRLLKQLVCLHVDEMTRVPNWIGELTALVELHMYHEVLEGSDLSGGTFRVVDQADHYGADNDCSTGRFVKELGKLKNLRVLKTGIKLKNQAEGVDFLESLRNLHKIQDISTSLPQEFLLLEVATETNFTLSSSLRSLQLLNVNFARLPAWMNGQCLPNLWQLKVVVNDVEDQDLEILGTLQELRDLALIVIRVHRLKLTSCGCNGFQNLRFLNLTTVPLQFLKGAMPRLENIKFSVTVMELKAANISFDFGLENLSSLQSVNATIDCADSSPTELEEMEAAIRHAVDINPNHPALVMKRKKEDKMAPPGNVDSIVFERLMYTMLLNKEIEKLNQKINVQDDYNNKLYSEAREMAKLLPEGHPSIAKMQLRRQVADTILFNQRTQIMKDQEQLLELYNNENKQMTLINEELKAALNISHHVPDAEES